MRLRKHDDARCRRCRQPSVWYGLKQEATGWTVLCVCRRSSCGHEWTAGWIPMSAVDSVDDAYRRGEESCLRSTTRH